MQDIQISLAVGKSAKSKTWKNTNMLWSEFCDVLKESTQTRETLKEFLASNKEEQGRIKDVGGYVGGYLRNGKRNPDSVVERSVLTLDVDFATTDFFELFKMMFDYAAFIHATHKHNASEPRYRLLIPLNRGVSADEYIAVGRRIAGDIGIEMFDNTTFEVNRLMFWPSHPKDVEYYWEEQKGNVLDVDDVLAQYKDWKDTSLWPTADRKVREIGEAAKKQEDPFMKKGIVGAFCRTYTIQSAIETFLSEVYQEATDGRYTYLHGSTSCGLVIYDNTFAYSHHGTDPTGGKLCNAFDLVRLHRFGHLDQNEKSKKSYTLMEDLAKEDMEVRKTLARENFQEAKETFSNDIEVEDEDIDWMSTLEITTKGEYLSSAGNINAILQNDKYLKDSVRHNEFDSKRYICKSVPWRKVTSPEPIKNVDYSGIRNYVECIYGISSQAKIEDSLTLEAERNSWHPIREYLKGLVWDGVPRVETLLVDYFGAEDTLYTRQVMRKWLAGAVSRIFRPGCKFDLVLVLVDVEQGSSKSTFFNILGKSWFSDTFMTVHGKEALEQIQGAWIIEMAELAGLRKADIEAVKHFITKQQDMFRPAYARTTETYPRQCVFAGTTNNREFLRDPSGNRRFLPIDVVRDNVKKSVFDDLETDVDQIWAEAMHLVAQGEKLYLSAEVEEMAKEMQSLHSETDERTGLITRYLDTMLPTNWDNLDLYERRTFLESESQGTVQRKYVCVAEIWCECLGKAKEEMTRYNTKDLNDVLKALPEWEAKMSTKSFKSYGTQRYYERKNDSIL